MASAGSISKITLPSQATYDLKDAEARAALSAKSAVSVDGGRADVDIRHISKDDYEALVARGAALSNTLYLVSADYVDAYGQQIRNIQPGSALSDAASYGQVLSVAETALTAVPPEYKTYAQTILTLSADGYAIGVKVNGEVKKAV